MAGLFGESPQEQDFSSENFLGLNQAPDNTAKPGEPEGEVAAGPVNDGANVMEGQTEQVQEPVQQPEPAGEEKIEQIDVDAPMERKVAFVKQKYSSTEDFVNGVEELQKKLGRENEELGPNMTQEDIINYYISLENELGRTSDIDNTRQENQRLQQELQGLRNTLSQMMMQRQGIPQQGQFGQPGQQMTGQMPQMQGNIPMRDPNTGRFVSPATQKQEEPEEELDLSSVFDEVDTDKFMEELYEKGPKAESFQNLIIKAAEKIADKKANEAVKKTLTEQQKKAQEYQQKQQQALALKSHYDSQIEQIKQKYGEQEFEKIKQNVMQFFRKYPMYLNPQLFPNGFEIAFNEARNMNNQYQQQQNAMQNQQQYNTAQKMAARMPASKPSQSQRFGSRKPDQDEIEKQMIFGGLNQGQGIFG